MCLFLSDPACNILQNSFCLHGFNHLLLVFVRGLFRHNQDKDPAERRRRRARRGRPNRLIMPYIYDPLFLSLACTNTASAHLLQRKQDADMHRRVLHERRRRRPTESEGATASQVAHTEHKRCRVACLSCLSCPSCPSCPSCLFCCAQCRKWRVERFDCFHFPTDFVLLRSFLVLVRPARAPVFPCFRPRSFQKTQQHMYTYTCICTCTTCAH